jgi:hypothetical protein
MSDRDRQIQHEARSLSSQISNDLSGIAELIRDYVRIVESGNDRNGNALANLRYFQRKLSEVKTTRIHTSL